MATTIHPEARRTGTATAKYLQGIAKRLEIHGEPVKHLQDDGDIEWVKVQFHDIESILELGGEEIGISTSNPFITGRIDWFAQAPRAYQHNHSTGVERGSKIVIRGVTYQVQPYQPNHRGGFKIPLVKDACCEVKAADWDAELASILCEN